MPSTRRVKVLAIAVAIAICTIFYLSNDSSSQKFYARTVAALDKKEASDAEVARKLQEVKDAAKNQEPVAGAGSQKPLADSGKKDGEYVDINVPEKGSSSKDTSHKAPSDKRPLEKEGEEKSVAGRKTMKGGEAKSPHSNKEVPMGVGKDESGKEKTKGPKGVEGKKEGGGEETKKAEEPPESKEEHELEVELNSILKKGPIIIFSKSYCPFSAKAKHILLDKYTIVPAPHVVELDQHKLGSALQSKLEMMTGRRTVPNVLINGKSIGGGDDVEALDAGTALIDKVKSMGGKRIMEMKIKED